MRHKVGLNGITPQGLSQSLVSHRALYHHIMWKQLLFYEIFLKFLTFALPHFYRHILLDVSRNA